jgi:biotin synthase
VCYAIPGLVEEIENNLAIIDYFGEKRKAYNELEHLSPGDFVYAQGGFVIKKIPPEEAQSILSAWKETFFELQEVDLRLSRLQLERKATSNALLRILDKVLEEKTLSQKEALFLLNLEDEKERELLYKTANFLRRKYLGNSCCVHGIIEFSNFCSRNCGYCGISIHNRNLKRYRMSDEEIIQTAIQAIDQYGFQALVLQSGEDPCFPAKRLAELIKELKRQRPVLIFVSCGEVGERGLEILYQAGARGILMRFETSNPVLYEKLHPGYSLEERIQHLKIAYQIGYLIITGALIGLPGQSDEDLLNDIFLTSELRAEMCSFGPFLPHPETPLGHSRPPNKTRVLNALALIRILAPKHSKILVTTAFETLDPLARENGLMAGANSLMLNVTPAHFRKQYVIYPHRAHEKESLEDQIKQTLQLLYKLGRAPTDLGTETTNGENKA